MPRKWWLFLTAFVAICLVGFVLVQAIVRFSGPSTIREIEFLNDSAEGLHIVIWTSADSQHAISAEVPAGGATVVRVFQCEGDIPDNVILTIHLISPSTLSTRQVNVISLGKRVVRMKLSEFSSRQP